MATVKELYASAVAITCTLASLGATSGRESASVDNTTNLYLDALVQVKLKSNAVSAGNVSTYIYVAASVDGGTTWPDVVTGSDAAITVQSPTQLRLLGTINWGAAGAAAGSRMTEPMSVASVFGGNLPKTWSIVIVNDNAALTATGTDHVIQYQGINQTVA